MRLKIFIFSHSIKFLRCIMYDDLTQNQRRVFLFIKRMIEKYNISPTIREIMDHFGYTSPNSVYRYLNELEIKGYIYRRRNAARGIILKHYPEKRPKFWLIQDGKIFAHTESRNQKHISPLAEPPSGKIVICVRDNSLADMGILENHNLIAQPLNSHTLLQNGSKVLLMDASNTVYAALCTSEVNKGKKTTYRFHPLTSSPDPITCPQDPKMVHCILEAQIIFFHSAFDTGEECLDLR